MSSALEMVTVDPDMLPSASSKATLIEMMIQAKTMENSPKSFKQFTDAIKKMLGKLQEAQAKHEQIHKKMMTQCLEEEEFRTHEENLAKTALARSMGALTKCKASLDGAQKALPGLRGSHKSYSAELQRATEERNAEHKTYLARSQQYKEAILFLEDFISYVNKKFKGEFKAYSLVEMTENLLKHANKLNLMAETAPILVALAQASKKADDEENPLTGDQTANNYNYNANEEVATKLKTLLAELLEKLKSDDKANDHSEASAAKTFMDYSSKLKKVIDTLAENIKRTEKQIDDMTLCIDKENAIIVTASAKFERNNTLKLQASKMCHSFNLEFIEATKNRLNEIQTMHEIIEIIKKRLGTKLKDNDVEEYLLSVENGFKTYVNSTEFKNFVEYDQKKFLDNKRGALLASKDVTEKQMEKAGEFVAKHS